MHSEAYLAFIVDRVAADDRLAPLDQLIAAWWIGRKEGGTAIGQPRTIPLPRRIRAADLFNVSIDLYSATALHLFARRPEEMLETGWAVSLRSVTAALFDAEDICGAEARHILERLVKRVALSTEEAQELKRLQRLAEPAEIPDTAPAFLDELRIPLLQGRQSGWAAYADARVPMDDMKVPL